MGQQYGYITKAKALGLVLCFLGLVGGVVPCFFFQPPKISDLSASSFTLTAPPRIYNPGRVGPRGILPALGVILLLDNVCKWGTCAFPQTVATLQKGEPITVWRDGSTVWQIEAGDVKIYEYAAALRAYTSARREDQIKASAVFLVGVLIYILAILFRLRAAAKAEFESRKKL